MTPPRKVYLLDPQTFSPEVIAVAFAKTSRSPESFLQIASELNSENSAEFHEKWVVGYGHSSVAEHAVLHIAVENASRLAVETLEANRLASYTEKSTRYQKWGLEDFYTPAELDGHLLRPVYLGVLGRLFEAYQRSLPAVRAVLAQQNPRQANESESAWERRLRSDYVDVCRFLLPAASLANVGVTINARALEYAIAKLLSHPLAEVRAMGAEIKQAARGEVPTLVKYADAMPYSQQLAAALTADAARLTADAGSADWCRLTDCDPQAATRVLAAALYRYGSLSFEQAVQHVQTAGETERRRLADVLIRGRGKYDPPLRELEYAHYTFDVIMDQGAYYEVKRHRMMTQTAQALTPHLGYCIPRAITLAGFEDEYCRTMDAAAEAYETLAAWNPAVASYVVPNGYRRRVLLGMNLRSADHFITLRSAPNAHFSVRRVAQRIAAEIQAVDPLLGTILRPTPGESWQQIEQTCFTHA